MADEDEDVAKPPPPGCIPKFVTQSNMVKYGLAEEGAGLADTIPYKLFDMPWVRNDIASMGIYSEFHEVQDAIKDYPAEEQLLLIADPENVYGENWLLCVTVEARDAQFAGLRAEEEARLAAEKAKAEAEEAARLRAEAEKNAVWEAKPYVPRPFVSETAEATAEDVARLTVTPTRPTMKLAISRARCRFNQKCNLQDQDAEHKGVYEFRQHKDPNFALRKREIDVGLQYGPGFRSGTGEQATQTRRFRRLNKSSQYVALPLPAETMEAVDEGGEKHAAFCAFLQGATLRCEQALQKNETVDIFAEELSLIGADDLGIGKGSENNVKELRSFTHLTYSKNKCLPAVDWHPTDTGVMLVTCTDKLTFDQRVSISGKAKSSYNLIWNFNDFVIHPQLVLQAPHECLAARFNPTNPDLIAAGMLTGQVCFWNITEANEEILARKAAGSVGDEEPGAKGDKATIPPVKTVHESSIDNSHRRPVADLHWMPNCWEVDARGNVSINPDGETWQFVTVAADGQICFWDCRVDMQHKMQMDAVKKRAAAHRGRKGKETVDYQWSPIYSIQLTESNGVGELGVCKIRLMNSMAPATSGSGKSSTPAPAAAAAASSPAELASSTTLYCTTEEGQIVYADWQDTGAPTEEDETPQRYIRWISPDHVRPCVALERSPFFPDILLSVGDWTFNIWKEGKKDPVFRSPMHSNYATTGRWSPTRPGVIFVAKVDGSIDVWDMTDQSHKPALTITVGSASVTAMEFLPSVDPKLGLLLAAADAVGALHVLDIPPHLRRAGNNEAALMSAYLEREAKAVEHIKTRAQRREKEEAEKASAAFDMPDGDPGMAATMPSGGAGALGARLDAEAAAKMEEAAEAEYIAMESEFRAQFGLPLMGNGE